MTEASSDVAETKGLSQALVISGKAIGTIIMVLMVANAVRNRTLSDFIRFSIYISAALVALTFISVARELRQKNTRSEYVAEILGMLLGIAVVAPFFYALGASVMDMFDWLMNPRLSAMHRGVLAGLATIIVGGSLFYFRLKLRSTYGITEALIGVCFAVVRFGSDEAAFRDPGVYFAVLTAGVYLVVRGLDNVHQGLTKDPVDPYAIKLLNRLQNNEKNQLGQPALGKKPDSPGE